MRSSTRRFPGFLVGWIVAAAMAPALAAGATAGAAVTEAAAAVAAEPTVAASDTGLVLQVELGSRLYPTWRDVLRLRLGELFYLGDSEYTARIDRFLPDFRIHEGRFVSASHQLNNPAARVIVYHDTTAADTAWAFKNFPPHFSPRAFFTFKLQEITGFVPGEADSVVAIPEPPLSPPAAADSAAAKEERHE